jgi:aryl carrier-like protein
LVLYADFIERFYNSRDEVSDAAVTVDISSLDSIMDSVRRIFGSSLPAVLEASPDTNLFDLGLDSLFVFQAVNIIRNAMGLQDKLAPRHLYANPTLARFSALLAELAAESKQQHEGTSGASTPGTELDRLKSAIDQHKARWSQKMNPFDYVNPNHYMGLNMYFPVREGVSFEQAFAKLQQGLQRAMQLIPALEGQITPASDKEVGYKEGDLRVVIPPLRSSSPEDSNQHAPRQLTFKDLSDILPSFESLRESSFLSSTIPDDLVLPCDSFPAYPADILVAQANFVKGGCILATNFHHGCMDAVGVMVALKTWAESCRFFEGDISATCDWLDPESFNHDLPEIVHELEGHTRRPENIDPGTWGFLPFVPPGEQTHGASLTTGVTKDSEPTVKELPPPPVWDKKFVWPPIPDPAGRSLKTTTFLIPSENLERLKQEVMADPEAKGVITSLSDIVQAFFWRHAIRARYRVAKELHGQKFGADETSILELPIDTRPHFSSLIPSTYMGSMLIVNRATMGVEKLCSPDTSVGTVAYALREAAARITPSLVHNCFTLLQSLPAVDPQGRFSYADMGLDGMHAMISNMMLFQPSEISFGDGFFGNGGSPETLRPQIERGSGRFRFLVIHPMRSDGGAELVLGTLPEELEMLKSDLEFTKYARLMDV